MCYQSNIINLLQKKNKIIKKSKKKKHLFMTKRHNFNSLSVYRKKIKNVRKKIIYTIQVLNNRDEVRKRCSKLFKSLHRHRIMSFFL